MKKVTVWDLGTRLYHWLQAAIFIGLMATGTRGEGPHLQLGLILFTLLLWRICWGFVGSDTSRFSHFVTRPRKVILYLLGKHESTIGHNPLGALMVISLLSILMVQCLTGMIMSGLFDGFTVIGLTLPENIYDIAALIHHQLANLLPLLVAVHVAAIMVYKLMGKPMLLAMLTGKQHSDTTSQPVLSSNFKAILVLISAILVTMAIVATSMVSS
ncbi:TPA: cytochrome b/b6 domain-containing protein [Vibrio vulnificus]|nr:cytochrome b/b6 domain-containing protein [Vibrio vulnificus]